MIDTLATMADTGAPPASVRRLLLDQGYVEVDVPGAALWKQQGWIGTWPEAVDRVSVLCTHLRQVAALGPKSFLKTSEFWAMVVAVLPMVGAGLAAIAGQLSWIPEAHREMVGGGLLTLSALCATVYKKARATAKAVAAYEQNKALTAGPVVGDGADDGQEAR